MILQVIGNLSFTALFLLTLFDGIDGRLIMASRDLGADPFHTLRFVILPAVRPGMLSVLFTLFTMNLADFGTPVVIGGKYKVLARLIFRLFPPLILVKHRQSACCFFSRQ